MIMDNKKFQKAKEIAKKHYKIIVSESMLSNGQKSYMAKNPELFGCMAQGMTVSEALQNLEEARVDYIYSLLKDGVEIPEPTSEIRTTLDTSSLSTEEYTINKQWDFVSIREKTQASEYTSPQVELVG